MLKSTEVFVVVINKDGSTNTLDNKRKLMSASKTVSIMSIDIMLIVKLS